VSAEPSTVNEATLTVRRAELLGPVLGRVVGMLAARAQCPIDRLDDALLLTDAVAAHAPGHTDHGRVTVHVHAEPAGLSLRVGPLPAEGARAMVDAASLPGIGNVFQRVADDVRTEGSELLLHLAFRGDTSH
jgi:serine/threonine-protein kinase RsbW